MNAVEKLSELFAQFPGIGQRQAKRFVYFLLKSENGYVKNLLESIVALKKNTVRCLKRLYRALWAMHDS